MFMMKMMQTGEDEDEAAAVTAAKDVVKKWKKQNKNLEKKMKIKEERIYNKILLKIKM